MNFELSHAVDDSDVAFVMRLDRGSTVCSMMNSRSTKLHKVGTNIDGFINLATLNYLLAGLQLCYVRSHPERSKWFELLYDLDKYQYPVVGKQLTLWDLRYITRELIVPFGVVRGSEKQGGQDETGISAATWPVNFVCNLVLDGHDRNVLNYWHYHDISAGDDLVFRLKPMPIPKGKNAYTLNHYYKRFVQHNFESYFQYNFGHAKASHVWQLVPDVFSLDYKPENDLNFGNDEVRMSPGFEVPRDYVWQEHGYWHIARSQVMVRKYAMKEYYNDDMANQLKVSHLDVTFEPAYCKAPGESRFAGDERTVKRDVRSGNRGYVAVEDSRTMRFPRNTVAPGMAAQAGWTPQLRLEELVGPMPVMRQAGGTPQPSFAIGGDIASACGLSPAARMPAPSAAVPRRLGTAPDRPPPVPRFLGTAPDPPQQRAEPAADPHAVENLDYSATFSDDSEIPPAAQADPPSKAEAAQQALAEARKSLGSIIASMGGNRGRKRKSQAGAAEGESDDVLKD